MWSGNKTLYLKQSIALTLLICTSACGNSSGSSANPDGNNSGSAGSGYEVVTVTKPENLSQYRDWYKNGYDACVGFAQIKNLPVKPFIDIPADFIIDKDTYVSDGKNYSHTTVSSVIKVDMTPESGCASSIEKTETLRVVNNGSSYHIDVQENGERVSQPVQAEIKGGEENSTIYTDAKVVNGIQLKCLPENATTQIAGQVCMIETQGSTKFIGYDGKYVAGYVRALTAKDQFGVVITEPVSVKASASIDPKVFNIK